MSDPTEPDGVDTSGSAVPPYEGRRAGADKDGADTPYRDGVNVGGAAGPVQDDSFTAPDPRDTPRGATASPADEQPATETSESDLDDDRVGPAHHPGTPRAEDQS